MKKLLPLLFLISTFAFGAYQIIPESVSVGSSKPDVSASLHLTGVTKGFVPNKMTTTQRNAIATPTAGLMIYNISGNELEVYNGSGWVSVGGGGGGGGIDQWSTTQVYSVDEVVIFNQDIYLCLIGHTAGVFATDLASGYWLIISDGVSSTGTPADMSVPRYVGTSGNVIEPSDVIVDATNNITGAASLAIGGSLDTSSILDLTSTTKGSKPCPGMTEAQRDLIATPANGLCIYNTTSKALNIYDGAIWKAVGGGLTAWVTATTYKIGDVVIESNKIYKALTDHTAGTFATDLTNNEWVELSASEVVDLTTDVTGILPIANGGTGSATQNFVDLTTTQTVAGNKTFTNDLSVSGITSIASSNTGPLKAASGVVSAGNINVASEVTGVLPIANGGTGNTSGTATINAAITGEVTSDGITNAATVDNAAVIAKTLTGFASGAGTVTSADSLLQAAQKLDGNVALKQGLSIVTTKGDLYGATASATTTRVPAGNSGELLTSNPANSTGLGYRPVKEDNDQAFSFNGFEDISTWQKGNAANVVLPVTGSFAGTLASVTSGPLNDATSYRYTQAAGSLNDYWCSPTKSITPAQKGETYFTANYTYDGQTGELQPYLYDVTNSGLINLVSIKGLGATNTNLVHAYAALIPQTTSQIALCYQVKTLNSGKIFNYATVQLTKSLSALGTTSNINFTTPQAFTPTFNGGSSYTNEGSYWWREGNFLVARGSGTITSPSGASFSMTLPMSLEADGTTSPITPDTNSVEGYLYRLVGTSSAVYPSATYGNWIPVIDTSVSSNNIYFSRSISGARFSKATASDLFTSGDRFRFSIKVPIKGWDTGNAQVASSNQITSSDSMVFVFKPTAIVDSDPVGTFNTYTYAANTNTATIAGTAPTQTSASMNTNGVQVFSRAYTAASTASSPTRVVIKIGKGLKSTNLAGYFSASKVGAFAFGRGSNAANTEFGTDYFYDESTGLLTIDAGYGSNSSFSTRFVSINPASGTSGYFTFTASTQPSVSVIPNASLCINNECVDKLSAQVTGGTGAITANSQGAYNWLSSCTAANPTVCTFTTPFTVLPTCGASDNHTANGAGVTVTSVTLTTVTISGFTTTDAAGFGHKFKLDCSKNGADARPTNFKVAGLNDISVSYWLPANFSASTTIPINFSSEEWDNCTPKCVTVSPTAWKFTAPRPGVYTISGVGYVASAGEYFYIYKNNSLYKFMIGANFTTGWRGTFSTTIKLSQGEFIDVRTGSSISVSGGSLSTNTTSNISIQRTGEY